jgi:hypothetical protein
MAKTQRKHVKADYRSGLEEEVAAFLSEVQQEVRYEKLKIEWKDLRYRVYTSDFVLDNGIIIETKGRFVAADRNKHLEIQKQHPKLDIRFVFTNSKAKLYKGSKTTYGMWCEKNGFLYSDRIIPQQWLQEKGKPVSTDRITIRKT